MHRLSVSSSLNISVSTSLSLYIHVIVFPSLRPLSLIAIFKDTALKKFYDYYYYYYYYHDCHLLQLPVVSV